MWPIEVRGIPGPKIGTWGTRGEGGVPGNFGEECNNIRVDLCIVLIG